MPRLRDYLSPRHGDKARLLLTQLGIPFGRTAFDILTGLSRTPEFRNRLGHVAAQPGYIAISEK